VLTVQCSLGPIALPVRPGFKIGGIGLETDGRVPEEDAAPFLRSHYWRGTVCVMKKPFRADRIVHVPASPEKRLLRRTPHQGIVGRGCRQCLLPLLSGLAFHTPIASGQAASLPPASLAAEAGPTNVLLVTEGLVLHLDAGTIPAVNDGDPVYSWHDLSQHGSDATAGNGSSPSYCSNAFNGLPALHFDGVNEQMAVGTIREAWGGV